VTTLAAIPLSGSVKPHEFQWKTSGDGNRIRRKDISARVKKTMEAEPDGTRDWT